MNLKETLNIIKYIFIVIIGFFMLIGFVGGIISVLIHKKRYGNYPICQGYGKK